MRKKAIALVTVCVMVLVVVFFEFYVFRTQQVMLTVHAWNDASISFGSQTLMFFYIPLSNVTSESKLNFPFPFPPGPWGLNPPTLIYAVSTGHGTYCSTYLNATTGALYSVGETNFTVAISNPSLVLLIFKPLS